MRNKKSLYVLCAVFVLSLLSITVFASPLSYEDEYQQLDSLTSLIEENLISDYPVAPLSDFSSYTLYAFVLGRGSTTMYPFSNYSIPSTSSSVAYVKGLSTSSSTSFNLITAGVYVTIPANTSDSYVYISGLYPYFLATSNTSWYTTSSPPTSGIVAPSMSYFVARTSIQAPTMTSGSDFNGIIFLPAHSQSLNIYLYATIPGSYNGLILSGGGAYVMQNAFVSVVNVSTPYSSVLNNIYSRLGTVTSNLSTIIQNQSNTNTSLSSIKDNTANTVTNTYLSAYRLQNIYDEAVASNSTLLELNNQLKSISTSIGPSPMDKFESDYIDKFEDELSYIDDVLSPSSSLMPGDGSVTDFASDLTSGMGLSGSSFDGSKFSDALDAFSGSGAVAAGGPWEFFSQDVVDSLSGDTSAVGLSDDDYIYAWLEQSQRRYGIWSSSSP